MTLEPTDAVAHTQSIVAEMDRQAARIAELEQQVSVGYESIAMMSGKMRDMKDRILALEAERDAADIAAEQNEESMTARIAELEAENARLHQIIESSIPVVDMSDLSVGVPSQVVRVEPLPAPDEAVVATPLVRRRNQARCLVCGDVIESKHRHDYVSCRCGAIAVDGGADYERRIGYVGFFDPKFVATPLAPPVNKIATYPRNSPANGVDEQ